MKKFLSMVALATALFTGQAVQADVIAQWDFNGPSATDVPGGATSPTVAVGTGNASLIGGTTATFASGVASGGSTDPVNTAPPNYGWNITTFAAQGTENLLRGVQFNVSTVGWQDLVVSWDQRLSNTAPNTWRFQYTTDGSSFVDSTQFTFTPAATGTGDVWYNGRTVDLTGVLGVADNPNFGFRIVAEFDPVAGEYLAARSTSTYGTAGTARFDMVTVNATAIPEPGSMVVLGAISLGGLAARRFRKKSPNESATAS